MFCDAVDMCNFVNMKIAKHVVQSSHLIHRMSTMKYVMYNTGVTSDCIIVYVTCESER